VDRNGIVIVGGGHGGSQIAASLREKGYDGKLTLVSAEAEIPYQRPPLSKAYLKTLDHDLLPLRPESFYAKNDIELRLSSTATAIDLRERGLRLAGGEEITFDRLALALGARPRVPTIDGLDLDGVVYLRDAHDARKLRDRLHRASSVVIVGGGFIGLEIAATARGLGKTVTVLEAADRLMGRAVAPEISRHFLALHSSWQSDIRLNTPIGKLIGNDGELVAVETAAGDAIEADLAVIGIGAVPNVELAQNASLSIENGICVDGLLQTSAANVVAVGDCVSFDHWQLNRRVRLESVQNAVDQAKTAAETLLGGSERYRAVPWFWSDQSDVKLQMVGLSADATRSVVRGSPDNGAFSVFHYKDDLLVAIDSVNRPADHMVGRRILSGGLAVSPEQAADESLDLKALLKKN
jgi:3-phenylpropionate/trans-cinnamate dioxygenase ferredoxin reductase subunit